MVARVLDHGHQQQPQESHGQYPPHTVRESHGDRPRFPSVPPLFPVLCVEIQGSASIFFLLSVGEESDCNSLCIKKNDQ